MDKNALLSLPNRLSATSISKVLVSSVFGRKVVYFSRIDSTNNCALALANQGAEEGTLVVANYQIWGRGRGRRKWIAPPNKGLLFSLILAPPHKLVYPQLLTVAGSIAVCKALRFLYNLKAQIKWPNDVLVNGKKICGLLTEVASQSGRTNALVMGIGLNVNQKKSEIPPHSRGEASSVYIEYGRKISRLSVLVAVLDYFESIYRILSKGRHQSVVDEWKKHSSTLGKQVHLKLLSREIIGTAMDMEDDGSLVIREDTGFIHKCLSGDIVEVQWIK